MSEADTQIQLPNRSQNSEHGGVQFEPEPDNSDNEDEGLLDDKSDFDAEPRLDDQRPCTPDDLSSSEEEDDLGEGSSMVGGDDLIDEQLFIPQSALFNPYQLGDINKEDDETVDLLVEIHPAIINTYI